MELLKCGTTDLTDYTDMGLVKFNIVLDIILIVMCIVGMFIGWRPPAWMLMLWVFIALMNNIEKLYGNKRE